MEHFDEWFAVRVNHSDDEFWPSRLVYDPRDGISLNSINFAEPKLWYGNPTFEAETITGYLDYQRPMTVIRPFIQAASPGSIGADTPLVRARYRIVAHAIIKNLHLEKLSDRCFTGLLVQLPSFHAWIAPRLLESHYTQRGSLWSMSVEVGDPSQRKLSLANGIQAEILSYASANEDGEELPVKQHTRLSLVLPEATDYETVMEMAGGIDMLFNFLLSTRLEAAVHYLPTTRTRRWNDVDEFITAESWDVPAWKRVAHPPHRKMRMFTEANTPVAIDRLLDACLSSQSDLRYLMGIILAVEMQDIRMDDGFVELLGCLEDFDKTHFGSGADPKVRLATRKIRRLVEQYGDDEEKATCERIIQSFRNEFVLRQRIERLVAMWKADGFRGGPNLGRLIEIRNMKPHGRGRHLSPEVFHEVVILLRFLCALGRYHVLKALGFDGASIASGFARLGNRYGAFIPEGHRRPHGSPIA